jgi:hypothetical protein
MGKAALNGNQLDLFAETVNGDAPATHLTREQAGIAKDVPAGAERLLAALVKRGLGEQDLRSAAELCLALDERPVG